MYRRSPLVNTFWADKRADMSKIQIPAYITGSDFGSIHTMGAIRGFKELNTENKWIRWAAYQEWFDLWSVPETSQSFCRFSCLAFTVRPFFWQLLTVIPYLISSHLCVLPSFFNRRRTYALL